MINFSRFLVLFFLVFNFNLGFSQKYFLESDMGNTKYDEELKIHMPLFSYKLYDLNGEEFYSCRDCELYEYTGKLYFKYEINKLWGLIDPLTKLKTNAISYNAYSNYFHENSILKEGENSFLLYFDKKIVDLGTKNVSVKDIQYGRLPYKKLNKWGVVDWKGNVLISPIYNENIVLIDQEFCLVPLEKSKWALYRISTNEKIRENISLSKYYMYNNEFYFIENNVMKKINISNRMVTDLFVIYSKDIYDIEFTGKYFLFERGNDYFITDITGKTLLSNYNFQYLAGSQSLGRILGVNYEQKKLIIFDDNLHEIDNDIFRKAFLKKDRVYKYYIYENSNNKMNYLDDKFNIQRKEFDNFTIKDGDKLYARKDTTYMEYSFRDYTLKEIKHEEPVYEPYRLYNIILPVLHKKKRLLCLMDEYGNELIPAKYHHIYLINSKFYCIGKPYKIDNSDYSEGSTKSNLDIYDLKYNLVETIVTKYKDNSYDFITRKLTVVDSNNKKIIFQQKPKK